MDRAIGRGGFWRSTWEVRDLLVCAAGKEAARNGSVNHFDDPRACFIHVRDPGITFYTADLELVDFQAAMDTITASGAG
jgi:hypothetical protein